MEPDVGVDDYDVSRVEDGADDSPTGPPAFRGRFEVPGLTTRYLSLPGGHVHVINMEVGSGPRGSDEDPRLLWRSGVRVDEVRPPVELVELLGHLLLADGPAHVPVPRRVGLHPEDGAERGQVLGLVVVVPALLVVVLQDLWLAAPRGQDGVKPQCVLTSSRRPSATGRRVVTWRASPGWRS